MHPRPQRFPRRSYVCKRRMLHQLIWTCRHRRTSMNLPMISLQCWTRPGAESFISESMMRSFLQRVPEAKIKEFDHSQIDVNPDLPPGIHERYRQVCSDFADVFCGNSGEPPVLDIGPPYKIVLKPGATPFYCPRPRWSPAREQNWRRWAIAALEHGWWERTQGPWASRGSIGCV